MAPESLTRCPSGGSAWGTGERAPGILQEPCREGDLDLGQLPSVYAARRAASRDSTHNAVSTRQRVPLALTADMATSPDGPPPVRGHPAYCTPRWRRKRRRGYRCGGSAPLWYRAP